MRFIIGVDGGGTGTRARLCNLQGQVLGFGEAGPSGLSQGLEQAWRHVLQAVRAALAQAGLADVPFSDCALGAGLAGAHEAGLKATFLARQPTQPAFARLVVDTDGFTALLGAHGGQAGMVLVAGTGSVAEACWPDGHRHTVGGWGFGVGDEGSGAWLGLQAVRHVHHVLDGQTASGPLDRAVLAATGRDTDGMRSWCAQAGQRAYATLAPLVFDHEATDPHAAALINIAVVSLTELARALDPAGELPIVCAGSIAQRLQPRLPPFLQHRCVPSQGDATDGALHLIRQHLASETA
ncbi:MAG: ATPase [Burkholderiales bacterium PBB6]|jgi:glucosamine kinase|uniref:BadF/BadG/BcrA/BcrD ATPase family protein n=1 Tax=Ideonella margarita TaxID=2984191 RepID=A0ABU9CAV0_9BURK|nr:MAG: ATPase [Burkholderiales bacterium PBB6]